MLKVDVSFEPLVGKAQVIMNVSGTRHYYYLTAEQADAAAEDLKRAAEQVRERRRKFAQGGKRA